MTNLLDNALKFTSAGTVTLRACPAARRDNDERPWLHVSVQDTGIGMTPDQMGQLFQHFSQADGSTTRRRGGNGLVCWWWKTTPSTAPSCRPCSNAWA